MGFLKRLFSTHNEDSEVSEQDSMDYIILRNKIETNVLEGVESESSDLERYNALQKKLRESGLDTNELYNKYKEGTASLPQAMPGLSDDADQILREPDEAIENITYRTMKKGEEIITKKETQKIRPDGTAIAVTTVELPIAVCGKRLSSHSEIAGFCSICDEAVCQEHAKYCQGYEDSPCNKLLCPKHSLYLKDKDGEKKVYCFDHYQMMTAFQREQ